MHNTYIAGLNYEAEDPEQLLLRLREDQFSVPLAFDHHKIPVFLTRAELLSPGGPCVCTNQSCEIRLENGTEARYYSLEFDGSMHVLVRSVRKQDGIHLDYVSPGGAFPLPIRQYYNCLFLESCLLDTDALILHSSSILYRQRAVLFTAPSQTGKSTQAELWRTFRGANVMNGDRNIIGKAENGWYACGLPWHGTSPDCLNTTAPLGAVVVIRQAPVDAVRRLGPFDALRCLYSETTVNSWDTDYVNRMLDLISALTAQVPVFQLSCTMQESAVTVLERALSEIRVWE